MTVILAKIFDIWLYTQKKKLDFIKIKYFYASKYTVKKRQVTGRRKYFQNLYPTKDWYLDYNKKC